MVHEFGHWIMLQQHFKSTRVWFGIKNEHLFIGTGDLTEYAALKPADRISIYGMGILLGIIPIIIAGEYISAYYLLLAPYALGIKKDMFYLLRDWKQQ